MVGRIDSELVIERIKHIQQGLTPSTPAPYNLLSIDPMQKGVLIFIVHKHE